MKIDLSHGNRGAYGRLGIVETPKTMTEFREFVFKRFDDIMDSENLEYDLKCAYEDIIKAYKLYKGE